MAASSHSKYRWWMIATPLVLVAAFASWQLSDMPQAIQGYLNGSSPLENSPRPIDENTPSMDAETPEAADIGEDTEDPGSTRSSTADGVDDFGACDDEAHTYCSGFYTADWATWAEENGYTSASWKLGLVDCLGTYEDELSQACVDSLERRQELNEDVNTACSTDRKTYCAGVEPMPGSEPQVDCLKENYDQLSEACAEALDAHEDAKALEE